MDLENNVLSEISQTQKEKHCMISHTESKKYQKSRQRRKWEGDGRHR
jgi:hypothetical protein